MYENDDSPTISGLKTIRQKFMNNPTNIAVSSIELSTCELLVRIAFLLHNA